MSHPERRAEAAYLDSIPEEAEFVDCESHTLDVAECVFDTYQPLAIQADASVCTVVATHSPTGTQATVTTDGVGAEETRGQAFAKLEQLVEAL